MRICSIAFLLGILFVQQLSELPSLWWGVLVVPLGWLSLQRPHWSPALIFVAGIFWVTLRAGWILGDALPVEVEGRDLELEGYIADIAQKTDRGVRFEFDVTRASHDGRVVKIPRKVLLNSYDQGRDFSVGERWRFVARLKRPHGFQNPGGFDYEGFLFRKRIRATGYIRETPPRTLLSGHSLAYGVDRLRERLGDRIRELLSQNAFAGMIVALANGNRRGITNTQWNTLRRTGTNHLMAISGLHIGLVGGFVFLLVRWLWALPGTTVLRWPAPKAAAVAAMLVAVVYAALAGFSVPTQRAMIMLGVAMGAVLLQRRSAPTYLLAIALFLVLLHDPLAVMGAGFWLSFAAVTVIILFIHGRSGTRRTWRRLGYLQWGIALGLLPVMLVFFQQVSLVGPLANMVAVPVFALLVVPLTLAGAVSLTLFPNAIAELVFQLAVWPLEMLWIVLEYLAGFAHSLWVQHSPVAWALMCGMTGAAIMLAPAGWPARWLGVLWLLPTFVVRPPVPATGELWLTLLDVGQGLAVVVRTREHTLVYDTGARFSSRFDAGRAVVVPYLRSQGIERIDTLIISHGDNDHIGGAPSVVEALPVDRVLSSVPERLANARRCQRGQTWQWDGVDFAILNPPDAHSFEGNNACCVLMVGSHYGRILLPGDIEAKAETALLERERSQLAADVLVVPHHGSRTSSTEPFVEAVKPRLALFPVGYRNRFRHPHPRVKARYLQQGAWVYTSAAHGAIELRLGGDGIETSIYRKDNKRYWFDP
ncbi:MAG: DNA internalization-related competence protein ComEC/Rec2 [Acidiferrobacterales bacterium]